MREIFFPGLIMGGAFFLRVFVSEKLAYHATDSTNIYYQMPLHIW